MSSTYSKPHLTFAQQVDHLRGKGMIIEDEPRCIRQLTKVGYYRLSAYWHPFKIRTSDQPAHTGEYFRPGTRFEHAVMLHEFDGELRRLVLEGVECVEISLRVWIAYVLGARDTFAYMKPEFFHGKFTKAAKDGKSSHAVWLEQYASRKHRPQEDFARHLIEKYGEPLPIWASVELWEFNQLCFFFSGMRHEDKVLIAGKYKLSNPEMLHSWLKAIKGIRNHAAHHGRVWNRNMAAQPALPAAGEIPELDFIINDPSRIGQARACCPLLLMSHMIRQIDPECDWPRKLRDLLARFPTETGLSIERMGFPRNWLES